MKKVAVLGIMFFIIFPQVFADENFSFSWQLFSYQENNQKINFINLNPMFFINNNYLSINFYENIGQNNNFQNNRNMHTNSQENNLDLFSAIMYTGALFASWSMNRHEREIHYDMWKQQKETENIYRGFYSGPARNFYQGIY